MSIRKIRLFLLSAFDYSLQTDSVQARVFSFVLSILIFLSILFMILGTIPEFTEYVPYFIKFEYFTLTIFSIEYFLRLWIAPLTPNYKGLLHRMSQPFMLFDLLVLFPFWIALIMPDILPIGFLMSLRVFRLLRQKYYFSSLKRIVRIIMRHKDELWGAMLLSSFIILLASTAMYYIEHDAQPEKFSSIPQSLYWGVVTFATLGYGDIVPITPLGKLFTSIITMLSLILYSLPASIIASAFYAEIRSAQAREIDALHATIQELELENKRLSAKNYGFSISKDHI